MYVCSYIFASFCKECTYILHKCVMEHKKTWLMYTNSVPPLLTKFASCMLIRNCINSESCVKHLVILVEEIQYF